MTDQLPFPDKSAPAEKSSTDNRPGRARKGRVFLLDGTALAYRSHFAMVRQPLLASNGQNISALYVFANTLFRLLEKEHPDYLAVAFDPKGKTFRHKKYPKYKATRDKTPDELIEMFPAIRTLVEGFNAPIVQVDGYEADDVIATLALEAADEGHEVMIVTGDKDFLQIVSPKIRLYNILRQEKGVEIQGAETARKKFGVDPEHVVDVLALMGDSSDNVPGVAGIGPKTAAQLIQEFGTVENLYDNLDKVEKPGTRKKLEADHDSATLSKDLVTFDLESPVTFDAETFQYTGPDPELLGPLFKSYEMDSLLKRVSVDQGHDEHTYITVNSLDQWNRFSENIKKAELIVFDTETTSIDPMQAKIVGASFCFTPREAWYLPFNLTDTLFDDGRPNSEHFAEGIAGPLGDPDIPKAAQNAKYDLLVLKRHGIEVEGVDFDTMIASYCVSPGEMQHNLDHLALKFLNFQKVKTSDLIGTGKKQITMDQVDIDVVGDYACEDADMTARLVPLLKKEMEDAAVGSLFQDMEMPLLHVLMEMERTGVAIDVDLLQTISSRLGAQIDELTSSIHSLAGEIFNINSPKQLAALLFEKLAIQNDFKGKRPRRTKTGFSTDARSLDAFKEHPLVQQVLQYRILVKLKGTYVDALPTLVNDETGRIHTSYNQTVAATGRLSSSAPNLQNIPIRTEEGRQIRKAFVPCDDRHLLLSADYSQVELRLLAHLSKDAGLIQAFKDGADIHRWTAGQIFGLDADEVPADLRGRAKSINFGVIYGMGPQRLAAETGMSVAEASKFIDAYFETFAGVKDFIDETLDNARTNGFVTTLLGRRRYISELDSSHPRVAAQAKNVAVNTPIQGTAADLIKIAMIRIHELLSASTMDARMIIQVHDELVFEVAKEDADALRELVVETMQGALQLDVPLVVDVGIGSNWLEAH